MTTRRQFMISVPAAAAAFALADHFVLEVSPARAQQIDPLQGHFHPKGKAPSKFTLEVLQKGEGYAAVRRSKRFRGAEEGSYCSDERSQDHG